MATNKWRVVLDTNIFVAAAVYEVNWLRAITS